MAVDKKKMGKKGPLKGASAAVAPSPNEEPPATDQHPAADGYRAAAFREQRIRKRVVGINFGNEAGFGGAAEQDLIEHRPIQRCAIGRGTLPHQLRPQASLERRFGMAGTILG